MDWVRYRGSSGHRAAHRRLHLPQRAPRAALRHPRRVRGSHFRKVKLPADSPRRGLLGHGSILTVTSTASRTSPVMRGSWILENLLRRPSPAPPPGVETNLDGDGTQVITTSVRERLEAHRQNPSCAACHDVIDPVGFALENFDAIGAWRDRDGDSSGRRERHAGGWHPRRRRPRSRGGADVAHPGCSSPMSPRSCMTYALGRAVDYRDMPTVRAIVRQAQRAGSALQLADPGHRAEPAVPATRLQGAAQTAVVGPGMKATEAWPFITRRHLSRRAVLRGAGTALALPLLESMVACHGGAPGAARALRRHLFSARRHDVALDAEGRGSRFHLQRDPRSRSNPIARTSTSSPTWAIRWRTGPAAPPATTTAPPPHS